MTNVNLIKGVLPRKNGDVLVSRHCDDGTIFDNGEKQLYSGYDSDGESLSELVGYSESDIFKYKVKQLLL